MNSDQIYNQAVANVWEIYRTATFNYIYHDDMAAHYASMAFWFKVVGPTLIVLGVVSAMWPAPSVERAHERKRRIRLSNIVALLLAIAGVVTSAMAPDGPLSEHKMLSKQWLAVVEQIGKLRSELHAIGPTKESVPAEMLARIDLLKDHTSALMQGEFDETNPTIYNRAVVQTRQRIYGEEVLTKDDAIKAYKERQERGLIPERKTAEDKPRPQKKPGALGTQSIDPSTPATRAVAYGP